MRFLLLIISGFVFQNGIAQTKPFIKLQTPSKTQVNVSSSKQFIVGATCKTCSITINGKPAKVYKTGGFGAEIQLDEGENRFEIVADGTGNSAKQTVTYYYKKNPSPSSVKTNSIEYFKIVPDGNLVVSPGEKIGFEVKALPDQKVEIPELGIVLNELPSKNANGMAGIYKGTYTIKDSDVFNSKKLVASFKTSDGKEIQASANRTISTFSNLASNMVITKGRLAFLEFGLGDDRLGGSKIGYLDGGIPLQIIGQVDGDYKVKLSETRTAYVPIDQVDLMPKGTPAPSSLTANWRVYGDGKYDYVTISLSTKLPYQSMQLVNPSKIVVDIFGATNNSNWITQLQSTKEIKSVDYQQVEDGVYRVIIDLIHPQHWGHAIYYNGNNLVIRIKQQPTNLDLSKLTIAIDAGHGGSNTGAEGPTGTSEKALTLDMSLRVQKILQSKGAKVLMTRTVEKTVANLDRVLYYRDNEPDLLVSLHFNSAVDPFKAGGTSTFYKYIGFRPLSLAIYKRMLELGLKEYGNIGSFNFMLNSPIEYPNALVEMLFLSNLEEEEKVSDENFRQAMAEKIVMGIQDFLNANK